MSEKILKSDTKIKILALVITLLTVVVFLPALQNDFVNWDDPCYVYENQNIRTIDLALFKWMFAGFDCANWHPLTWLSHAIDYAVWGPAPMGHHLTNIVLHGLNTFLVVLLIIRLMLIARPGNEGLPLTAAVVTGFLFGLHPLHVESVVWISERKDLLCAFFFLLSILSYLKYVHLSSQKKDYIFSLLFFVLALMSKPMAVTLPVVLIILDIYPLERLSLKRVFSTDSGVLVEKVPFLCLSLASSIITVIAQQAGGAVNLSEPVVLTSRVLTVFNALIFYLYKMVWPSDLAPLYPYPKEISISLPEFAVPLILVTAVTALCILSWKREKLWSAVWAYYIAALLPVLGIMKFGSQAAADRYTYLPSLAPFLLIGLAAAFIYRKITFNRPPSVLVKVICIVPLIVIFFTLSTLTIRQIKVWENSFALWEHELSLHPDTVPLAYLNLGKAYSDQNDHLNAVKHYDKAIDVNPRYARAYYNRGTTYVSQGRNNEAIDDFGRAIEVAPRYWDAYYNRGKAYEELGDYSNAMKDFHKVIEINPEFEGAYYNLGVIYDAQFNNYPEALKYYDRAIEIKPDYAMAYNNRGIVYAVTGDYRKAVKDFTSAVDINSKDATAYENRGHAYKLLGDNVRAEQDLKAAARLKQQGKR